MAASSLPLLEFEGREIPAIKDEVEILLLWLVLLQATLASSLDDDDIMGSVVMTSTAACGVGSSVLRKCVMLNYYGTSGFRLPDSQT